MKRLVFFSVLIVAFLGFAVVAMALETSVFGDGVLIRAYIDGGVCSGNHTAPVPCTSDLYCAFGETCTNYSAHLEVRDNNGNILQPSEFIVTAGKGTETPNIEENPFLIHNADLLNNDISMSYDSVTKTIYVLCTDAIATGAPNLHVMKYKIIRNIPVDGGCVTYSTGLTQAPANPNLCTSGDASNVSVTALGWSWTCYGNGIGDAIDANCTAYRKVKGVCGSSNGLTLPSIPTTNLCNPETNTTVNGTGPWTWTCNGSYGGDPASCSANKQQSVGSPDLTVTAFSGVGSCYDANTSYNMSVTIKNQGDASTASANRCGQIAVKIYLSSNASTSGTSIGTWYVGDLGVGQSVSNSIVATANANCSVHNYCVFVVKVDADNCVTESNEDNNIRAKVSYRGR